MENKLQVYNSLKGEKETAFLIDQNIFERHEIESRCHVAIERYNKTIEIEAITTLEMVTNQIMPVIESQLKSFYDVLDDIQGKTLKTAYMDRVTDLETVFTNILASTKTLRFEVEKVQVMGDEEQLPAWCKKIFPLMKELRSSCDRAELLVSDQLWPLPKYREMLFTIGLS